MKRRAVTLLATAVVGASPPWSGGFAPDTAWVRVSAYASDSGSAPLFESHDLLTLRIEAPLKAMLKDRNQESTELPAILSYVDPRSGRVRVPVDIRTRGTTRLQSSICDFPPLRLDFPQAEVKGTEFAKQDKLKLVTHCRDDRPEYEQYVLQEYLVYRIYNLLTDLSFRVRLARITYFDTDGDRDTLTKYAFLIEDEETMAARNGWEVLPAPGVPPDELDPVQLSLLEVFQYMIGNSDWSAFSKEPGKRDCCHNTKPVGLPQGPVFPVPYDFDLSGLVGARYANRVFAQNLARMGLGDVRERRYQGRCASEPHLERSFTAFNENREAIYALYRDQEGLEEENLRRSLAYLDEFYEVINDPDKASREIVRKCRRV